MNCGNDRPIKRFSLQATSLLFIAASAVSSGAAHAGATFYSSFSEWSTATSGAFDTLDFNLGSLQFLAEQYSQYGVHFNGTSALAGAAPDFFPLDGWGIASASVPNPVIPVALDGGRFAFGVEFIADARFQLYSGSNLVWDSGNLDAGFFEDSKFAGVIVSQPFDSIKISGGNFTTLEADNFYVGHVVPAPGALAALALLGKGRRRQR